MPQNTTGPQKVPFSLRSGSPSLPRFYGEETDGDDPATIRPGSFRVAINVRRLSNRGGGGSIAPRGGMTKVNATPLGSPVIGLHDNGDESIVPAPDGFCGSGQSALVWERANEHYVFWTIGTSSFCAVMPSDNTFGVDHIVGRPRWGVESGLGPIFYLPGSSDIAEELTKMRVTRIGRGPYPLQGNGVYNGGLSPLLSVPDPTEGVPGSGFYTIASLPGAPNIGDGTAPGEQFFLGWSHKDGAAASASDFHVYRYEATSDDSGAAIYEGEALFNTSDEGHIQVYATPMGEIVAVLNAPDQLTGDYPQGSRFKYRNASGTWANLPALNIASLPVFGGGPLATLRNITVHDAKVHMGKLWMAVTARAFNGGGVAFGNPKGLLLSWDGTTFKAERVVGSDTASNYSRIITLDAQFGNLYYGWNISTASPDTKANIGRHNGASFNDVLIEFFSNFGIENDCKIRHLIFAAGRWWAILDDKGVPIFRIMSTMDLTMAADWSIFASITNPLHEPNLDGGTPNGEFNGEEAIGDIQVL